MGTTFPGYPPQGLAWLRELGRHNDRAWFAAHRDGFETHVRGPTLALVEALNARLRRSAPEYVTPPGEAVARIHRDMRFTKDPTPYKTAISATFRPRDIRREACAFLRFQVDARGVTVIGGVERPDADALANLRAVLAEDGATFARLLGRKAVREGFGALEGERLKRMPRGHGADHPWADLLRHRQFLLRARVPRGLATSPRLTTEVARRFRTLLPIAAWLDEGMR